MLCYYRTDQRTEALKVYERCRKSLALGLGIAPSASTVELFRKISAENPSD